MPKPQANNYTREQRIAQSADRHQAVTAGAGAGKTSVLVQRYIHLLFNASIHAGVREIVAITFTRKAAAEMKHRIAEVIESRLADEAYRSEWQRIKFVRERFSGAQISTIHSYCARLLREFPIEAGVNPNFTELEEYDITIIKEQAINETLEAWLEADDTALSKRKSVTTTNNEKLTTNNEKLTTKTQSARRVWTFFGRKNLFDVLTTLLQSAERFNELRKIYDQTSNDELFEATERIFLQRLYTFAEEYCTLLTEALATLDFAALSAKSRPNFEELSSSLAILRKQAREALQSLTLPKSEGTEEIRRWQDALDFATSLQTALWKDKLVIGKGSISGKYTQSDKYFTDKEAFTRLNTRAQEPFATLGGMLNTMEHHDHDRTILDIARTLMEIATDAWAIVREEKERLGGLDFDDLQIKADALLDNADVRQKIRLNTRFLMIDEFQDTDELQYRIARKIIGVLGDSPESTPSMTNLFIVGDPKQSIYRFRGADVRVFAKAKRDIERFNRTLLNHQALAPAFTTPFGTEAAMNETEQAGIIGLRATFRLLPEIAAFVNVVAGSQLRSGTTEYDVEYDDIVCGIPQNISAKIPQGSVTMLLPRVVKNDEVLPISQQEEAESPHEYLPLEEKATKEISEPKLLAEYLRHSCHENSQEPIMVRSKEGTLRAATYSDVMILVRSRTGTDALLGALRRAGVPFMLSAGRGFYERQEILDIRSFLLFLQNTNDDIALAAVLRSPFFALSDTELYCIRRTKVDAVEEASSDALWQRFEVFCEQEDISDETDNKPSNNALRAHTTLKQLLPLAAQLSIPTLIRTILEQTSWRAMLAADERFEQMEANLEKLLLIARKYENKGFRNLYDFAEELRRLALYAFSEGEADTETGKNAVRIMTIHGAKGLEAPIVVLYNTNAEASAGERGVSLSFDNQLGMSFKMLRSREDGTLEHFKTPLHYIASKQDEIAEEAELKRLLYVALTRAKDHLLISGKCEQKKDGTMVTPKGFLRMIIESLGAEALNLLNEPYIPFHPHQLSLLKGEDITEQSCSFTIPIIRALEQFSMTSNHEARVDALLNEYHEQTQTAPQLFTTSVPPLLLGTLETSIEGDVYSASQLQLFRRDPDEYERLYRLGLPVADEEGYIIGRASSTEDDADAVLGTMAGTCIHAVLEHLPLWMNAEGNVLGAEFQRVVERVLPERVSLLSPDVLARIQRETQAIAASPLLKRFASEVNAAKFEVPIQMPIDQDFLIGSIDALVQMPNGDLEIWDWKTNRAKTSRDLDAHLQHYRLQLEIYAFVVAHVRPEQQIFRTRLLFSRLATSSAKDEEWSRVLEFTRLDIQAIESKIRSTIAKIRARSYGLEMA